MGLRTQVPVAPRMIEFTEAELHNALIDISLYRIADKLR